MEQQTCEVHKSRMRGRLSGARPMSEHTQTPSRGQTCTDRNVGGRVITDMWSLHTCCRWHTPAHIPLECHRKSHSYLFTIKLQLIPDLVSWLIPTGYTQQQQHSLFLPDTIKVAWIPEAPEDLACQPSGPRASVDSHPWHTGMEEPPPSPLPCMPHC